jgi:Protein of unknown function (DUF3579)
MHEMMLPKTASINALHQNLTSGRNIMTTEKIIIEGLTRAGKPFRPSDWVDRMCSTYASFGADRKLRYSPYLKPEVINGVRCLAVDLKLKEVNPEGYSQLMHFADENQLNILDNAGNSIPVPA